MTPPNHLSYIFGIEVLKLHNHIRMTIESLLDGTGEYGVTESYLEKIVVII